MTARIWVAGAAVLALAIASIAGYRLGTGNWPGHAWLHAHAPAPQPTSAPADGRRQHFALVWREPDGKKDYRLEQIKTPEGRLYIPVYDERELDPDYAAPTAAKTTQASGGPPKILYYRNPMGLADTSPVPKKDWMGMDYIPVYEGEQPQDTSTVTISPGRIQRSGVRSEPVALKSMARQVRTPGIAKPDERTLKSVTLRFNGYIEKLYANETGQTIEAGAPLFDIFSAELISAQIDYRRQADTALYRKRGDAVQFEKIAAQRFRNLEVPKSVIQQLDTRGAIPQRITWPSPASGIIIEKKVIDGQKIAAGEELFRIVDMSTIWVIADVPEQDLASIEIGQEATVSFRALPSRSFKGKVTFILHEIDAQTRTAKVRIEVENPDHLIRHEMYADVSIKAAGDGERQIVVPASAVIDTGTRQVVIVDKGEGRFEPRAITAGLRADGQVEVREGLKEGEMVVVSANFLIDAESNIKAALEAFAPGAAP